MRKLLNTAYVTTEGAALSKEGETLVAEVDGAAKPRIPLHMLASVVAFGPVVLTPALIEACAERGITIALLGRNGRFQARIEGPVTGNVLLRREQYRRADAPEDIVRSFVLGKVSNQRAVIRRALRDHGAEMEQDVRQAVTAASDRMAMILRRVQASDATVDAMRGSESEAANIYFAVFDHLIRSPDAALRWTAHRVYLVDEQDGRSGPARHGKGPAHFAQHVAQMAGGLPFGETAGDAGNASRIAHGTRKPSLSSTRRPVKKKRMAEVRPGDPAPSPFQKVGHDAPRRAHCGTVAEPLIKARAAVRGLGKGAQPFRDGNAGPQSKGGAGLSGIEACQDCRFRQRVSKGLCVIWRATLGTEMAQQNVGRNRCEVESAYPRLPQVGRQGHAHRLQDKRGFPGIQQGIELAEKTLFRRLADCIFVD